MGRYLLMVQHLLPGGTETHVLTLAKSLVRAGHRVGLFTTGGPFAARFRDAGVRIHGHGSFKKPGSQSSIHALQSVVARHGYSVVHAHDSAGYRMLSATPLRAKKIMTVHGTYVSPVDVRHAGRVCHTVIAVSPAVKSYVIHSCKVPQQRVHMIPNGVSTATFHPSKSASLRKARGIPAEATVIGYAGRFTLRKAQVSKQVCRALAEYATRHSNVHVLIAGRMSKEVLGSQLGRRVHVLGITHDMPSFYRNCDIVVGTARVAIEAMACEVPTIAVGEARYIGRITSHNIARAHRTNFGDHGSIHTWSSSRLWADLDFIRQHLNTAKQHARSVRGTVKSNYSNHRIFARTLHLYR